MLPGDPAQFQDGLEQVLAFDVVEAAVERLGPHAVLGRVLERPLRLCWRETLEGISDLP